MYFKVGKKNFNLTSSPLILGILNLTPDSFYDGNQYKTKSSIFKIPSGEKFVFVLFCITTIVILYFFKKNY